MSKTIKIKELGKEFSIAKKYMGEYCDIKVPEGWELIHVSDAIRICDNEEWCKKVLNNKRRIYIWCKQLNMDKKNKWVRVLYRYGDSDLVARSDVLAYSSSDGWVVFSRRVK